VEICEKPSFTCRRFGVYFRTSVGTGLWCMYIYVTFIISEILTDVHIAMENKLETAVISNNTFLNEVDRK
jgi:hypothetical protein